MKTSDYQSRSGKVKKKKKKKDGLLLYGWMTWGCVLELVMLTLSETGGERYEEGF